MGEVSAGGSGRGLLPMAEFEFFFFFFVDTLYWCEGEIESSVGVGSGSWKIIYIIKQQFHTLFTMCNTCF